MPKKDRSLSNGELKVMLAIQRRLRDAYGVVIRDEIEERTGERLTFGVIYTLLARLERDGLLRSSERDPTPERGGRAKRYYELTGAGVRAIQMSLRSIDQLRPNAASGLAMLGWRPLFADVDRSEFFPFVETSNG